LALPKPVTVSRRKNREGPKKGEKTLRKYVQERLSGTREKRKEGKRRTSEKKKESKRDTYKKKKNAAERQPGKRVRVAPGEKRR